EHDLLAGAGAAGFEKAQMALRSAGGPRKLELRYAAPSAPPAQLLAEIPVTGALHAPHTFRSFASHSMILRETCRLQKGMALSVSARARSMPRSRSARSSRRSNSRRSRPRRRQSEICARQRAGRRPKRLRSETMRPRRLRGRAVKIA